MRKVTYSMSMSLDGYIVGPDGGFDWSEPDDEVFRLATEEVRGTAVHLMGRRLYEVMLYWEPGHQEAAFSDLELEFAALWNQLPKVVFSTTLTDVEGAARLASGGISEEVARLRSEPGDGDIAVGGATLAAAVADLGLIDEYRIRVYPVLVGGGTPFFAHEERRVNLELLESRPVGRQIAYLRYRVRR